MDHKLRVWSNGLSVGVITFDDTNDVFSLEYDADWVRNNGFPLSPRLTPLLVKDQKSASVDLRRFLENLLPEGQALEDVASVNQLSKSNLFGLVRALGKESAGAFSLLPADMEPEKAPSSKREITYAELSSRIRNREQLPFSVWDGRVRMSIAGFQDKIAVFKDQERRLFLVEGRLASTHILKPTPRNPALKHLAINEFFCMSLAKEAKIDVADVELLRVPEPVLLVKRFDRIVSSGWNSVERIHIVDGCQALGLPSSYKYERNFGSGADVRHIRDGASLPKMFALTNLSDKKSQETLKLLRWVLFQYAIGNTDAHAKNLSYFADEERIRLAPAYDLVSVEIHDCFDRDIAMAIGDTFEHSDIRAYDWAEFGCTCGIPRKLLEREMMRTAKAISTAVQRASVNAFCIDEDESAYIQTLVDHIKTRVERLEKDAKLILDVSDDLLSSAWRMS